MDHQNEDFKKAYDESPKECQDTHDQVLEIAKWYVMWIILQVIFIIPFLIAIFNDRIEYATAIVIVQTLFWAFAEICRHKGLKLHRAHLKWHREQLHGKSEE